MDPTDNIFSSIWPLLTDEEWNQLENESFQNGIPVPCLHPLDLDDGVEGSWLDPPLSDPPGGNRHHISSQIPHEPDHSGENEVGQFRTQSLGKYSLGPDSPSINSIFSSCLPLFTDEEWNWLENESYQNGIRVSHLHPLGLNDGVEGSWLDPSVPDQPGGNGDHISDQTPLELDHLGETEVGEFRIQTVGTNSLGPEHPGQDVEVETEVRDDGVEGSRLDHPAPDEPEENVDHISSQITQEPDHPGENEVAQCRVQNVGTNSLGPEHQRTNSIFSSCFLLFIDEERNRLENEFSDLHPQGPISELETEVRDGGIDGSGLHPPVPDKPGGNGDHIPGQIPQEPDHTGESEVGQFTVQAIGTSSLGPEFPGKDGEGENFRQRPEHAPPGLAPEASCNLRKQRGKPPKHPELAPVVLVPPRRGRGRPPKCPELAPVVPGAAANPQDLPREQSTQHSRHPKDARGLPDGWITEVKVRKEGYSAGHKDKTYIELITNKRCRSIPDVWRYMEKKRKLQ